MRMSLSPGQKEELFQMNHHHSKFFSLPLFGSSLLVVEMFSYNTVILNWHSVYSL